MVSLILAHYLLGRMKEKQLCLWSFYSEKNAVVIRLSIFSDMNRTSLERPLTSSDSEDSEAEEVSRDQDEDPSKVV